MDVEILYVDPWLVELRIRASNGPFAATVDLYESLDVLASLASTLAGFPTSPSDVRERTLGNFNPACGGGGVRLRFDGTDAWGHAAIHLTVRAEGVWQSEGGSARDEVAEFTIRVDPASIDRFVGQLRSAETREGWRAHLPAHG
jgi:hypothetical protein